MTWQQQAACRDSDLNVFFPVAPQTWEPARAICTNCPVTTECLHYAETNGLEHGMFGGLDPDQRHTRSKQYRPPLGRCVQCGRWVSGRKVYCSKACKNRTYKQRRYVA